MTDRLDLDQTLEAAIAHHQARDLDQAATLYGEVLKADPRNADALNLLGVVLQDRGLMAESVTLIAAAIEIEPDFPEAHANLARGLNAAGQSDQAAAAAKQATELDPGLGEAWEQFGAANAALGRDRVALDAYRKAAAILTDSADVAVAAASVALRLKDYITSAALWRDLLRTQPDRLDVLIGLGAALAELGQLDEALTLHRRAAEIAPEDPAADNALTLTLYKKYDGAELVSRCERKLALDPGNVDVLGMLASARTWLGQFEEAKAAFQKILVLRPDHDDARRQLIVLAADKPSEGDIALLRGYVGDPGLNADERCAAGFALGKALDRMRDHDGAFLAYKAANALAYAEFEAANKQFDRTKLLTYNSWAYAAFPPDVFATLRPLGNPSELPVFVVGMPRSGTTLVEQIAASHPRVHGLGERKDMVALVSRVSRGETNMEPVHWDPATVARETALHIQKLETLGGGADRVTDKMPDNVQIMGHIAVLFPNARIIVCRRDLRDICVSCYTTRFGDGMTWTYDLEDCASRAVEIDRLTDHWMSILPGRVLEVSYEKLVANLETESRRLIDFLGLPWDPACLDFHKTERQVITASVMQVRQPLYNTSVGRWRRHEAHLGPLLAILAERIPELRETAAAQNGDARRDEPEPGVLRRGLELLAARDYAAGTGVLRDAVARFPKAHDVVASLALALTLTEPKDFKASADMWRRAVGLRPNRSLSHANLAYTLNEAGQYDAAIAAYRRAVELEPDNADHLLGLAGVFWRAKDIANCRDTLTRANVLAPDHALCLLNLGHCEAAMGRFKEAIARYRRVLELNPSVAEARAGLIRLREGQTAEELAILKATLGDPGRPAGDRIWAGFGLGQALDNAKDRDGAFAACRIANDLVRKRNEKTGQAFHPAHFTGHVDALISLFPASVFARSESHGDPSDLPVFVVGLPRSGTSLVEQILASHPDVFGAGERTDLLDAANELDQGGPYVPPAEWDPTTVTRLASGLAGRFRALGGGRARVIDKLPDNLQLLGHLGVLLPKARIIICRRDPRDTGLSCYFTHFTAVLPWSNDLRDIAANTQGLERLAAHWRAVLPNPILEVRYEDLVGDLEGQSRRLIEFLGLDWDPACLEFHRTSRTVNTASNWQVRQSLYTSSIGRWRAYERHLGPLIEGLHGLLPDEKPGVPSAGEH